MAGRKPSARKTKSPGLVSSFGRPSCRARFVDPDTGRMVKVRLDPTAVRTAEARREWAMKKSRALAKRKMELEAGAPKATGTTVEAALERYFDDHVQLRPGTVRIYRHTAENGFTLDGARRSPRSASSPRLPPRGSTPRYAMLAPFVATLLLTGMRLSEVTDLEWSQVDLDALDHDGRRVGEIRLFAKGTKTKRGRTVGLEVSPGLHRLLSALKLESKGQGRVFAVTKGTLEAGGKRVKREFGAPSSFGFQVLRQTCGTYLTNHLSKGLTT